MLSVDFHTHLSLLVKAYIYRWLEAVEELKDDMLEKMRKSVDSINFQDKTKNELKQKISSLEWGEQRIIREILLMRDYERRSVNSYSQKEALKELLYQTVNDKEAIEKMKHKLPLYKIRSQILDKFIEERAVELFADRTEDKMVQKLTDESEMSSAEVEELVESTMDEVQEEIKNEFTCEDIVNEACVQRDDLGHKINQDIQQIEANIKNQGREDWQLY